MNAVRSERGSVARYWAWVDGLIGPEARGVRLGRLLTSLMIDHDAMREGVGNIELGLIAYGAADKAR